MLKMDTFDHMHHCWDCQLIYSHCERWFTSSA